ncbi:hypothetical protein ACHAWX_003165 [Stephanocyclus meneghinianus]
MEMDDCLRHRSAVVTTTSLPSLSGTEPSRSRNSSLSDEDDKRDSRNSTETSTQWHSPRGNLFRTISFITSPKRRLSRQSSLTWGHRPSPIVGASCFLFLMPIPLLIRACCYTSAMFLAAVTVSSFLSDHCYTGLESGWHTVDRVLAPMALTSNIYSVYSNCGLAWASLSIFAVMCHLLANHYSKKGMYDHFVIWHSLWHAMGSGLIVFCFLVNSDAGSC